MVTAFVGQTRPALLPEEVDPDDLDCPLVYHERRRPYERTGLYRRVTRILTRAGLKDRASVQLLRHTYGYLAYGRTGGNLLFVQRQLGHAHPMVTSVYAQFFEESYEDLANQVFGEYCPDDEVEHIGRPTRS
jgi:integrase